MTVTLARLSGLVTGTSPAAGALALTGTLPTRNVQLLLAQLPEQASGEGVFASEVTRYTPVTGPPPAPRPDRPRPPGPARLVPRPAPVAGTAGASARPPARRDIYR